MANFWGERFTFDDKAGEDYRLRILDIGSSNRSGSGSGGIEVITQSVARRAVPYNFGIKQSGVLEFPITFGSIEPLDRIQISQIQRWLFGRIEFCKLRIIQDDLSSVYFNCHLLEPDITSFGNFPYAVTCKVQCDAPWAWENEKIRPLGNTFYNSSDDNDYLYPILTFTMGSSGDFSIINTSDNNREFKFTSLTSGETIIVDNYRKIITSSLDLRRISNFNKGWLRFPQGKNNLIINGDVKDVKVKFKFARKVGA